MPLGRPRCFIQQNPQPPAPWPGCLLPPTPAPPTPEAKAPGRVDWGKAEDERGAAFCSDIPSSLEVTDLLPTCTRLYPSDPCVNPPGQALQKHRWFWGACLRTGRGAYQRAGGGSLVGNAHGQRAELDIRFAPPDPTSTLLCALEAGLGHLGSLVLQLPVGFGRWRVLAPEQRVSLYFQLPPPSPRTLCHPFHGSCPSHTLQIVPSLHSPQLLPSVSCQDPNSFRAI